MRLSADPHKLIKMAPSEIYDAIVERRTALRQHRDCKLDDRCWLDDLFIWDFVDGPASALSAPPAFDDGMARCREFYTHRRAHTVDEAPHDCIHDTAQWDADLKKLTQPQLAKELARVQEAIRAHRGIAGRARNLDDDRTLYAALPEKMPADFRLPPEDEFLGEARAPHAGCPAFWRSHGACKSARHNLHRWGPCGDE